MNDMMGIILQTVASGGNAMGLVQKYLDAQDPRVAQTKRMIFGKSSAELEQTGRNLAREAGTTPVQLLSSLGISIPGQR